MMRRPASVFLVLFLFVLQMMGPFLHAHAHGQAGQEGLHVHIQAGVADDPDPSFKSDPGVDHWVEAMPQGLHSDADIALQNTGEPHHFPLAPRPLELASANSPTRYFHVLPQAPPGASPDYLLPLSLAPPLA